MVSHGSPQLNGKVSGSRIAIIAGSWHEQVMKGLTEAAEKTLREAEASVTTFQVAGSFELPLGAQTALESGFDAVVCLGVIIRGGTPHFEFVSSAVTDGLTRIQLDYKKPVGFGILTTDNGEQALDRAGLTGSMESKGAEAAEAVITSLLAQQAIRTHTN